MEIQITNFKTIAIPLLKEMSAQFPNTINITPDDGLVEHEIRTHKAVIVFLVSEGFIKSASTPNFMTLTAKGLELFGCNIADELGLAMQRPSVVGL